MDVARKPPTLACITTLIILYKTKRLINVQTSNSLGLVCCIQRDNTFLCKLGPFASRVVKQFAPPQSTIFVYGLHNYEEADYTVMIIIVN